MSNEKKHIVQSNAGYTPHHFSSGSHEPILVARKERLDLLAGSKLGLPSTTFVTKSGAGYTLVEMLVTVAIFSLAFVAIGAIFIGFTTAQSRANSAQRLLNEGSFILETITREIRSNSIDYSCASANLASDHTYLCLRSLDGRSVHFRFTSNKLQSCVSYGNPQCAPAAGTWTDMNDTSLLTVTKFEFHTYPILNPRDVNRGPTEVFQPMTTITMSIEGGKGRAKQHYDLQTVASSRVYNF